MQWAIKCTKCKRWQVIQKPSNIPKYRLICRICGKSEAIKKKKNTFITHDYKEFPDTISARGYVMLK